MRPIMTRDELAAHRADSYGRNYSESDDGIEEVAEIVARTGRALDPGEAHS